MLCGAANPGCAPAFSRRSAETAVASELFAVPDTQRQALSGGTSVFRNSCATRKPRLYCSVKLPWLYAG